MKNLGLLGRKKGMTQIFGKDGACIPVTVIQAGPCVVIQTKGKEKEGYAAIQVGFEETKAARVNKPQAKNFEKRNQKYFSQLKEFRVERPEDFQVGQMLTVEAFKPGDRVDVQGVSKGRGFQGVIKRHGKHGGPDAHGSDFHRRPGSIGMRTWPGRVLKNMRLPGRMGADTVAVRRLEVVEVQPKDHCLLVRGSVPGAREGLLVIYSREKDFVSRLRKEDGTGSTQQG